MNQLLTQKTDKQCKIKFSVFKLEFTVAIFLSSADFRGFKIKCQQNSQLCLLSAISKLENNVVIFNKTQVLDIDEGSKLNLDLWIVYGNSEKIIGQGYIDFMTYQAYSLAKIPFYNLDKQSICLLNFKVEIVQRTRLQTDTTGLNSTSSNLFTQIFKQNKSIDNSIVPNTERKPQPDPNLAEMIQYLQELRDQVSCELDTSVMLRTNMETIVHSQHETIERMNQDIDSAKKQLQQQHQLIKSLQQQLSK